MGQSGSRGSPSRCLGPGLGLGQMLGCINPTAGGFLTTWVLATRCHSSCVCKGTLFFAPFGPFPFLLFISPLHSWLFSSASSFCLPMGNEGRRRWELCPQPAPRSRALTRGWQAAERRARNPPPNRIIQLICIAICCHKSSARSIH